MNILKLYSCVIGIGNTALPFTNEHISESSDSKNGSITLKITGKMIYLMLCDCYDQLENGQTSGY